MYEYPIAVVVWNDAWASLAEVEADLVHHGAQQQVTVGFVVRSDDAGITLACEYDNDSGEELRSTMFIPRGMVVTEEVVVDGPA